MGEDSIYTALELYATADLKSFQNKADSTIFYLDSIIANFQAHSVVDEAYLKKAEVYEKQKKYDLALENLQKIVDNFSYDILGDIALLRMAKIYDNELNNKEKAADLYKKILLEHPDSIHVTEARKRYREIRDGDDQNLE